MAEDNDEKKIVHDWRRCKHFWFVEDENGGPKKKVTCGRKFYISVAEKKYFEEKGFDLPKRCYPCRVTRREVNESNDGAEKTV